MDLILNAKSTLHCLNPLKQGYLSDGDLQKNLEVRERESLNPLKQGYLSDEYWDDLSDQEKECLNPLKQGYLSDVSQVTLSLSM